MAKNFRDKVALSGITVLMIGVALLIFTFISAYSFLTKNLEIVTSQDLMQAFGKTLAPLIATCIHVMYLGVMGWIGSLLTIRGVTLIVHAPDTQMKTSGVQQQESVKQNIREKARVKPRKAKSPETEMVVSNKLQKVQVSGKLKKKRSG